MSDEGQDNTDDPLLGLLTDIAGGVAALSDRIDALEAKIDARENTANDATSDALAAIAEIAVRIYHSDSTKPTAPLSDDIINAGVLTPMIARWPSNVMPAFANEKADVLRNYAKKTTEEVDAALRYWQYDAPAQTHADRLRQALAKTVLGREMDARFAAHEKQQEKERGGRSR